MSADDVSFRRWPLVCGVAGLAFLATTCSKQAEHWRSAATSRVLSSTAAPSRHFMRVEELPVEPVRRVEDLPVAPPVAVRPLRPDELTPALLRVADDLLWNDDPPLGTEVPLQVADKAYVARLEWHFHVVGGPTRPWGYHKGVTLYATE